METEILTVEICIQLKSFCSAAFIWHNETVGFLNVLKKPISEKTAFIFDNYTKGFKKYRSIASASYSKIKELINDETIIINTEFHLRSLRYITLLKNYTSLKSNWWK